MSEENEPEEDQSPGDLLPDSIGDGAIVETRRLLLRPPHLEDAETIARLADNPRVARNLTSLPHPYRVEHALAWIGTPLDERTQRHLVCRKSLSGAPLPIGVVTLGVRDDEEIPRLGCWIGEPYWGCGYATEACHAVVDYAFLHQACSKLSFTCRVTNPAGRRLIEKCGFQMVAQELDRSAFQGTVVPVDRFQIDRRCWQSLRGWEPLRLYQRGELGSRRGDRMTAAAATG